MAISTVSSVPLAYTKYKYTATAGQTSISGIDDNGVILSYTVGFEQLYMNGVLLVRGQDYIATTGSSITGLTALQLADVIEIFAFSTFQVASNAIIASGGANDQVLVYDSSQSGLTRWTDDYQTLMIMGVRS